MTPQIRDIKKSLIKHGCRIEISGGLFTVSGLPSWSALAIVTDNIKDLAKLKMVEDIFSTPYRDHEKPELIEVKGCTVCEYTWRHNCPFHGQKERTPGKFLRNGCELYKKNNDIMF